jgi:hypothetical protein
MNPYTHQVFLYVDNGEQAALGQFFRDFGDQLEGFAGGEDVDMIGVSTDGNGPPDGWCFASFTTEAQANAFIIQLPNMPVGTRVSGHIIGSKDFDVWLSGFGMQRIIEDE